MAIHASIADGERRAAAKPVAPGNRSAGRVRRVFFLGRYPALASGRWGVGFFRAPLPGTQHSTPSPLSLSLSKAAR